MTQAEAKMHDDRQRHHEAGPEKLQIGLQLDGELVACRTEALGGHMEACDDCGMTHKRPTAAEALVFFGDIQRNRPELL